MSTTDFVLVSHWKIAADRQAVWEALKLRSSGHAGGRSFVPSTSSTEAMPTVSARAIASTGRVACRIRFDS